MNNSDINKNINLFDKLIIDLKKIINNYDLLLNLKNDVFLKIIDQIKNELKVNSDEQIKCAMYIKQIKNNLSQQQIIEIKKLLEKIKLKKHEIEQKINNTSNQNLNHDFKKTIFNKEINKNTLNQFKFKKILFFFFALLPIAVFIYLVFNFYKAYTYKATYLVDMDKSKFQDTKLNLYINEEKDTKKLLASGEVNQTKYVSTIGSPINIILKPEEYLYSKKITLSMMINGKSNWDLYLMCPKCSKEDQFIRNNYYIGEINDYDLATSYNGIQIYSRNKFNYSNGSSVEEWLRNNLKSGDSISVKNNVLNLHSISNEKNDIGYIDGSSTVIDKQLRGQHYFYVYLDKKLILDITKKDLNISEGLDELEIQLSDVNGNNVFTTKIEDDGISESDSNTFSPAISKKIEYDLPNSGIYLLSFLGNNDWVIKNIKINTNKIVLTGQTLILDPVDLYTEIKKPKNLSVFAWHKNSMQDIVFSGENNNNKLSIGLRELYINQNITLLPDKYVIKLQGDQNINGSYFSFSKDQYFEPFIYDMSVNNFPDFIIADYTFEKEKDWIKVSTVIPSANLNMIKDPNEIMFQLKNRELDKNYKIEKNLYDSGYHPLSRMKEYVLWGKSDIENQNIQSEMLFEWLTKSLPIGTPIKIESNIFYNNNEVINDEIPVGYNNNIDSEYNVSLRGNHEFYVYAKDKLNIFLRIEDINNSIGKDDILFSLIGSNGETACQDVIEDDLNEKADSVSNLIEKNIECNNLPQGTYLMRFTEKYQEILGSSQSDFIIKNIKINSNKFLIKDKLYNLEGITIYTNNKNESELDLYYWHNNKDQLIKVTGSGAKDIKLNNQDKGKHVKQILSDGYKIIIIEKGDLSIKGSNFALNPDNWFEPELLKINKRTINPYVLTINNNLELQQTNILQLKADID